MRFGHQHQRSFFHACSKKHFLWLTWFLCFHSRSVHLARNLSSQTKLLRHIHLRRTTLRRSRQPILRTHTKTQKTIFFFLRKEKRNKNHWSFLICIIGSMEKFYSDSGHFRQWQNWLCLSFFFFFSEAFKSTSHACIFIKGFSVWFSAKCQQRFHVCVCSLFFY